MFWTAGGLLVILQEESLCLLQPDALCWLQLGYCPCNLGRDSPHKWYYNRPKLNATSSSWTVNPLPGHKTLDTSIDGDRITGRLCNLFKSFKKQLRRSLSAGTGQGGWLIDDLSSPYNNNPVSAGNMLRKRQMPHEEAEAVVKQWQAIKAEALGSNHQVHCLPKILAESMLVQWQDLADCAKSRSCFWRFVLLQLSVIRADIVSDEIGQDTAEIDAVLEEAAELVDESQPKNPNYYSKYQIRYILKRQSDGSWRICGGGIQTPA